MPTYEYACTECDHAFETFQSFSEDSLTDCPRCQGRLRKVFNAVGVVFKGSGFYKTDSRASTKSSTTSSSNGDGAKAATGSTSDGAGSASSGSKSTSSGSTSPAPASAAAS